MCTIKPYRLLTVKPSQTRSLCSTKYSIFPLWLNEYLLFCYWLQLYPCSGLPSLWVDLLRPLQNCPLVLIVSYLEWALPSSILSTKAQILQQVLFFVFFLKSSYWDTLWFSVIYTLPHCNAEMAMAPHSSILAWKIPWMEKPGGLQAMESLRVGHDWATSLSLFTFMHWIRKWQPTPVFLPGESQGWGSLVGCHLWGRTESDTNEVT